jgi:branched-chain amino acid transport system ATP-binding protein
MALLEVIGLSKNFGGLLAVNDVSFQISAGGEIVGLIGPNGAGKTTIFNLISGFLTKSSGKVVFKSTDISKVKPYQLVSLGICRTFQLTSSFSEMSVLDNVKVATICKTKGSESLRKARETVGLVGLQEYERSLPGELPHGHLKRLDIARALATSPELLLLDEPFSGLTISEVRGLSEVLTRLKAMGITLIIIEHMLRELMPLADRVIVLSFGKKLAEGSPKEIVRDEKVIEAYLGKKWDDVI